VAPWNPGEGSGDPGVRRPKVARVRIDGWPAEERSNEVPESSPLEAFMQMSLIGGTLLHLDAGGVPLDLDEERLLARGMRQEPMDSCSLRTRRARACAA
jgi:hypothetical protein